MAESLINSIARLRVIEKKLLTKELVGRLVGARDYAECVKLLGESGYGAGADPGGDEIDSLITAQLNETYATVEELMPKRYSAVTDVFRMRHDVINVKLLYKLRLLGAELDHAKLDQGGVYDGEKLRAAIKKGDYSMLPRELKEALEELDVITYKTADPRTVSCRVDCAFISYALGLRNAFVKEYFGALADFTNMLSVIRRFPEEAFLPGGAYKEEELKAVSAALEEDPERAAGLIKSPLETGALKEKMRECFAEYVKTGHTAVIEKARDEYLIALASEHRSDIDSPAPIVGYLLAREREAEVVRLILTAKRSGIPMEAIEERSLTLYG
ncbi:MAG: V-type ATPase subunit [Clostridia bacterium]|nr:V-type ATPase subunit [Clostridia bacterium]